MRPGNVVACTAACALALLVNVGEARADIITYTDRAEFLAALGSSAALDDFESYLPGDISQAASLGDFSYGFDSTSVQPAVVPGAFGGQALGGAPESVFVGGNLVTLSFAGGPLRAFGADFYYAPGTILDDTYRLRVDDGGGTSTFAGNQGLDGSGDTPFFLGLLADPGFEFTAISILSFVPLDENGNPLFITAYQVDNFAYAAANIVPEPSTLVLFAIGSTILSVRRRRRKAKPIL